MPIHFESFLRLLAAFVAGALIGWDRETRGKPAGFRTLTLVSLSSAFFVTVVIEASLAYGQEIDVARAMAGIAQGVGFLGAGAILQSKGEVRWLTTAASLWAAAALGFACGVGQYVLAAFGTVLVMIILRVMPAMEEIIQARSKNPEDDGH